MEIVCPVLGAYKQAYPVVIGTAQANHRVAKVLEARSSETMSEVASGLLFQARARPAVC
jgi:hypothetical protein